MTTNDRMSASLIKLIDYAIFPACLMIVAKLLGLVFAAFIFGIAVDVNVDANTLLGVYPVANAADVVRLSSFSDFFMVFVMLTGFAVNTFRSIYLHDTHIHPKTIAQLARFDLLGWVKNSYKLYTLAIIWMIFSLMAVGISVANSFRGVTNPIVSIMAVGIFLFLTVFLIRDIDLEIEKGKKNLSI